MDIQQTIRQIESLTGHHARRVRDGWILNCPFHTDANASMKVWDNDGWCCLGCSSHGTHSQLTGMLDGHLRMEGLPHSSSHTGSGSERTWGIPVREYIYRDECGYPLFKTIRMEPKSFRQMRWTGCSWEWGLRNPLTKQLLVRLVLYHLDLMTMRPNEPIVIVEGEKDADRLLANGILATSTPMGATKWRGEYATCLLGRDVVIIPDNDPAGLKHRDIIVRHLTGLASVRVASVPEGFKDVSDWLDGGGTVGELRNMIPGPD